MLEICRDRITAAQLLDQCDEAQTVEQLRAVLSKLITRLTGVK